MIGSTIGSYRITGQLGEGGMGAVYRATDNIEREVAIKALHSQLTRDESRLQRFRAEAVALGRLHHPNIATLYHLLEQNGDYYMVMEYVEGQTLEDIVRNKGAMTPEMALAVFGEGLQGFEHAHARGVIHRDIKPSNLMVSTEGLTKITDFGIARMAGSGRMTQTGKVIGTLEYMSPEQVRGLEQDARSDIYSLGILLFELLTGRMPFTATSDYEIMRAHLEEVPPPARSIVATLPAGLDAIIAKALAKDPVARFQNVAAMRQEIEAVARELPAPPPAQTLLVAPQPVPNPTRQAEIPGAIPATNEAVVGRNSVPATNEAVRGGGSAVVRPTPTPLPKWAIPAGASLAALVLLGGIWAFAGRKAPVDVAPTPAPTKQVLAENNGTSDNSAVASSPSPVPTTSGSGGRNTGVSSEDASPPDTQPIPQGTPGVDTDKLFPETTKAPSAQPTAPPTHAPVAVATRAPIVDKPPTPRHHERVAPPRPRVVVRPRPRVVERPRPRPRPRVVVQRRPPRVVSRPAKQHSSGGSSEAAKLRAIIKGG